MPDLVRLYVTQTVIGFAIAAVLVAGLLWFDVAGLGRLVAGSDVGVLAALLLWVFNGIVFAGVQFAIAIMGMAEDDDDDDDDEGGHVAPAPALIPVRAGGRRQGRL
jgi:hypothetical protein